MDTPQHYRYHFSLGNSSSGSIGFCAAVYATSEDDAIRLLRDALPESVTVHADIPAVDYVEVYFGDNDAITVADIDAITPACSFDGDTVCFTEVDAPGARCAAHPAAVEVL
jgi:hypothetical protein